jgi:hypothetical protein
MQLEVHITDTQQLFAQWRAAKRTATERIPDFLLERVAALARAGISSTTLGRKFGVSGRKMEEILKAFPQATLAKFHCEPTAEECGASSLGAKQVKANEDACQQAQQESQADGVPLPRRMSAKAAEAPLKAPKSREKVCAPVEQGAQQSPTQSAVIQLFDSDHVQRIREHRAALGASESKASSAKNAVLGEIVSPQGTRLLLFEHAPPDAMRAIIGAFMEAQKEGHYASSRRG